MTILEYLLIGFALSMDAVAVCVSNSMQRRKHVASQTVLQASVFGIMQGIMPLAGFFGLVAFRQYIMSIGPVIALILLSYIGTKMIYEGVKHKEKSEKKPATFAVLITQGIATSIDALAVGVSFSALNADVITAAAYIAGTTFLLCIAAGAAGTMFGGGFGNHSQIIGGVILVAIGLKIFISNIF